VKGANSNIILACSCFNQIICDRDVFRSLRINLKFMEISPELFRA